MENLFKHFITESANIDYGVSFISIDVPPENTALTQIPSTYPSYIAAGKLIGSLNLPSDTILDYGAGKGIGTIHLSKTAESYEPYPNKEYSPTYINIPDHTFSLLVCLNVLNVLPPAERLQTITQIGALLDVGGVALIGTRGKEILAAKNKKQIEGDDNGFIILPDTSRRRYQKAFTKTSLCDEVQHILGPNFNVTTTKIGNMPAAVKVVRDI